MINDVVGEPDSSLVPEHLLRKDSLSHVRTSDQSLDLNDFSNLKFGQSVRFEVFECPELPLRFLVNVFQFFIFFFNISSSEGGVVVSLFLVLERDELVSLVAVVGAELVQSVLPRIVRILRPKTVRVLVDSRRWDV